MRKGSEMHDKSQVDIEGEPKTEPKARQTMDDEEVTSQRLRMNDVANTKTKVHYDGTTGDGVEKTILSSCGETAAKDKADDLRVMTTTMTSRVEEGFGTRLLETSGDEGVMIIEACMIKEDNGCEAYRFGDVAMNEKVKEVFVNNTTRVDDDHGETSSTLDPETWALADVRPKRWKVAARKRRSKPIRTTLRWKWLKVARQRRTKKTYGSLHTCSRDLGITDVRPKRRKVAAGKQRLKPMRITNLRRRWIWTSRWRMADGHLETFPTLYLETSVAAFQNQRETEETEGGGEKKKLRLMNMRKRPTRCTTTDNKGQADLKVGTKDNILTKKEGSNVRINCNAILYDESERRIWWIGWRQWFGWKEWTCSKWRDKVDIAGETEPGTIDEGE